MSKQVLLVAEALSNEKQIGSEVVFKAIELALEIATKKRNRLDIEVRVTIDRKTGEYETFRRWEIIADGDEELAEFPDRKIALSEAKKKMPEARVGDFYEEMMESVEFGRIAAQTARQVITQKVREAEREKLVADYQRKIGDLFTGTIKRVTRDYILLELDGKVEAKLDREEMIPNETVQMNDRIRVYLYDVHYEPRGPQLFVSRTRLEMLTKLFSLEVPEIGEQLIEIKGAARDPGSRSKIAVKTNDGRIDPIGACVGMRGSRVQTVSNELCGERIDIILWDDNPAQLVINAMAPAEVESIMIDENSHSMDIAVREEQLSQAIGRNGQNVRLASQLTGWTLNVMSEAQAEDKSAEDSEKILGVFKEHLGVDEEIASILVQEGFISVEEVAYVPVDELLDIEEFDEDLVHELRQRAQVALDKIEKAKQAAMQPAEDLLNLEGMTSEIAHKLAAEGIKTREDLAEMSVDEVLDMVGIEEEQAATLIMKAREHWFIDN